jgi:uncharacterized membrane protein
MQSPVTPSPLAATTPAAGAPALRFDRLDALRGIAIVWMVGFHAAFDLNHLGFLQPPFNFLTDPRWTLQRTAIVSLFLFCAGLGQSAALMAGQGWPRFWRRWLQVAGCAALVSAGSALMFPHSWISFGVLHGMAVMLVLARWLAPLRAALWPAAALALALPWLVQHPLFDSRWTNWVGLVTHKPFTEDYVPVLPWLGVLLIGLAAGRWLLVHRPGPLTGAPPRWAAPLAWLGRRPLTIYMVHQPLLIGLLMAVQAVSRPA